MLNNKVSIFVEDHQYLSFLQNLKLCGQFDLTGKRSFNLDEVTNTKCYNAFL